MHSPSTNCAVPGTPGRLGRKQALDNLKAAAAASPARPGQGDNIFIVSPSKQLLRDKVIGSLPSSPSRAPSATKRLSSSTNLVTPRFTSKKLKNQTPVSASVTTLQKENVAIEESPLRMRTIANRRATLRKSSKDSTKIKGLKHASENGSQITPKASPRTNSLILAPKHNNGGRTTLRPKSPGAKETKMINNLSGSIPGIKSTTSGLNILSLASSASSHLPVSRPAELQVELETAHTVSEHEAGGELPLPSVDPSIATMQSKAAAEAELRHCGSPTPALKPLACFSETEGLLVPLTLLHSASDDEDSIELDNMLSFHAVGQKLLSACKPQVQEQRPDLETPLSIPTVILPAIEEVSATTVELADQDESAQASIENLSKESLPPLSMPITASHSTATCGSYVPSACSSTPSKISSTLLATPSAKRLPRTAPSTPSSSPNSGFSFYNLLLPFNAQTGKPLNPQQERTQLELWRLRASAAGVTTSGAYASGTLKTGSNTSANTKGSTNANSWSVLERARTFGQTLWSSPQIKERAEKAKRKDEEEEKAKELEWVSKKLKISQRLKDVPVGSPMRQMMVAQTFWSSKMVDLV